MSARISTPEMLTAIATELAAAKDDWFTVWMGKFLPAETMADIAAKRNLEAVAKLVKDCGFLVAEDHDGHRTTLFRNGNIVAVFCWVFTPTVFKRPTHASRTEYSPDDVPGGW